MKLNKVLESDTLTVKSEEINIKDKYVGINLLKQILN